MGAGGDWLETQKGIRPRDAADYVTRNLFPPYFEFPSLLPI